MADGKLNMVFETYKKSHQLVAKNTYEVTFARPKGFMFVAGQYTQVALPHLAYADPRGHSRQFSIATSPQNTTEVSVVFRDSGSGFKRTLIELPVGSPVALEQGAGSFILPLVPKKQVVFVAGGVGISPFMSYVRTLSERELSQSVTLIYGNQHPESAAFRTDLALFAKNHRQFRLEEIYKQPTSALFAQYVAKIPNALWFVVGPPGMVATTTYGLEAAGIHPSSIIKESFDGY